MSLIHNILRYLYWELNPIIGGQKTREEKQIEELL